MYKPKIFDEEALNLHIAIAWLRDVVGYSSSGAVRDKAKLLINTLVNKEPTIYQIKSPYGRIYYVDENEVEMYTKKDFVDFGWIITPLYKL